MLATHKDLCYRTGRTLDGEWTNLKNSLLGDIIESAQDATRWMLHKVLTLSLFGPSLDLKATGLFGRDATLAGMLTWLGLLIAAAGVMWQFARAALTGQARHAGRALLGWVENLVVSACGVGLFGLLLTASDALTTGLVGATFRGGDLFDRVLKTMVPAGVLNPILVLGLLLVILLAGLVQLVLVFLRQSAIPIICLLLPLASAGRAGGASTRKWLPNLITTGLAVVAYKPLLALLFCIGFSEFGHSQTLTEWLRGCATLILAILAPGPLMKIFAPFGAAVGDGMATGGAGGALGAAAGYFARPKGVPDATGAAPSTAVQHAQYVAQSMGNQAHHGDRGSTDAPTHAARHDPARIPAQPPAPVGIEVMDGLDHKRHVPPHPPERHPHQ
ncbi:hypothetical protein [Streptomyces sp. RerS4]|uniref:hypothetical protein n=1 Tax=Streptomyces sp. RerS4 TaxID=2942449 RepID=UPI00201C54DD|nr:hypothetical protein [Streptomyces sp. RerS4]UQX05423.1 hypothetical protein M4D82_33640 [Streptomyces sp. RerS4]